MLSPDLPLSQLEVGDGLWGSAWQPGLAVCHQAPCKDKGATKALQTPIALSWRDRQLTGAAGPFDPLGS